MKEFETYLFDFDGTLVDSQESLTKVFQGAYGAVGVDVDPSQILRLMRIPLYQGYEELNGPQDKVKEFGDQIIALLDDEEILKLTKTFCEVKGVLLELVRMNKKIGIVTSNNRKHVCEVLKFVDMDEKMFSVIIGNFETKKHKPYPDPILKALEVLNISKDSVCYVGDGQDDSRCAINAGVEPILVDRLGEYKDSPLIVVDDLRELLDF